MKNTQNFAIVKTSSIGDIIHAFPVLEYLKTKFPGCNIDWIVESSFSSLVRAHPLVRNVICIDTQVWKKDFFSVKTFSSIKDTIKELRKEEYSAVFDLQGNIKSAFVTLFLRSSKKVGFSFSSVREKPNLLATNTRYGVSLASNVRSRHLGLLKQFFQDDAPFTPKEIVLHLTQVEKEQLQEITKDFSSPSVLVAFGSKWENKKLSLETLTAFLQEVSAQSPLQFVFVWASEKEKKIAEHLSLLFPKSVLIGKINLPLLQAVIYKVDAVIAMDSAILHLCGMTTTPSFSVFGPSSLSVYKPEGERHQGVQGPCPYGKTFVAHCPVLRTCPTGACIKNLSSHALAAQFLRFFHQK